MPARTIPEFRNEPLTDFSKPENRTAMEGALRKVEGSLGRTYAIVVDGQRLTSTKTIRSLNPSDPDQVVGTFASATAEQAEAAIRAADAAFPAWSATPPDQRSEILFRAASKMRDRKHEFSAWMVFEVGKSWAEADADTAEAIDFLEFYARENLRWSQPQPTTPVPGERNELVYIPLGVGAVIPPWNFPLAILVGMSSAAIVTGNTVVLKPSSDSPAIAWQFFSLLEEAGLPKGVFHFVPGSGSVVGETFVRHPRTRFIAFTGSKEVGLGISERSSGAAPGQIWIKRTILEMGGKDAIVVDKDADLDAAVEGVAVSAFGFQGQKCSACSRAIVDEKVYDAFVEKLRARVAKIRVGNPREADTWMGPVVNEGALKSISEYIAIGQKEGRLISGGKRIDRKGYFLEPTVIADLSPKARLSQEEIFGPVLAVIRAKDYDDALAIANGTEFGLTGAVYTKDPAKIEKAARTFHVGNLYINRKCTGALVGAHPFGGFNMSGTDSKAGGRDYLGLFLQAKSIARKL
jgi:1-pyrroline-5-carboxylate dehydrogenase